MEGHAPFPDGEEFHGILDVIRKVIEQCVTDPPAEKDAESGVHDHVIDLVFSDGQSFARHLVLNEEVRGGQADQVHQPIPAELDGAECHENRVDIWVGNGGWQAH